VGDVVDRDAGLADDVFERLLGAVAQVAGDAIEIESPLVLLDFGQVAFYRERAATLRELAGDPAKLVVNRDGSIEGVALR
jgi:hypothetical protein